MVDIISLLHKFRLTREFAAFFFFFTEQRYFILIISYPFLGQLGKPYKVSNYQYIDSNNNYDIHKNTEH